MKKILSGIFIVMIIFTVGCTKKVDTIPNTTNETSDQQQAEKIDFSTFEDALKKEGFKVEKGAAMSGCIGEIEGYEYVIDGTGIGVYTMDLKSKNPVTVNNIKMAKKSDTMNLDLQQGPMEVPAIINNNLVIMDYDKHPDKDKIIKVLKDLK
jgi:hypothetical protein